MIAWLMVSFFLVATAWFLFSSVMPKSVLSNQIFFLGVIIFYVLLMYMIYRHYRKRASAFVSLDDEFFSVGNYLWQHQHTYTSIDSMAFFRSQRDENHRITIKIDNKDTIRIPFVDNLGQLWEDLTARIEITILDKNIQRINSGETVTFSENMQWQNKAGLLAIGGVLYLILMSIIFFFNSSSVTFSSVFTIFLTTLLVINLVLKYLFLRSSGISVCKKGIKRSNNNDHFEDWEEIKTIKETTDGVIIHLRNNQTLKISRQAQNFFIFLSLIAYFVKAEQLEDSSILNI